MGRTSIASYDQSKKQKITLFHQIFKRKKDPSVTRALFMVILYFLN